MQMKRCLLHQDHFCFKIDLYAYFVMYFKSRTHCGYEPLHWLMRYNTVDKEFSYTQAEDLQKALTKSTASAIRIR